MKINSQGSRKCFSSFVRLLLVLGGMSVSCFTPSISDAIEDPVGKAIVIAKKTLISNQVELSSVGPVVITTGGHQYRHLWARDFSHSTRAMLLTGHSDVVKNTLELFFQFNNEEGLLPRLLDDRSYKTRVFLGTFGISLPLHLPLKPNYLTEHNVVVIDSNLLLPWSAWQYIEYTQDRTFAKKNFETALRALQAIEDLFLENHFLTHQPPFSDWEDSIAKSGTLTSTQFIYILSMKSLENWARWLGEKEIADHLMNKQKLVNSSIDSKLWQEAKSIYIPMLGDEEHYSGSSNIFPIAMGLIPLERSKVILDSFESTPIHIPLPGRANYPTYPKNMKNKYVKLSGLLGYHDEVIWVQMAAWTAMAYRRVGDSNRCQRILEDLSKLITKYQDVYEVYELKNSKKQNPSWSDLVPVRRPLYKAEHPFTWGASSFLEIALSGCGKKTE